MPGMKSPKACFIINPDIFGTNLANFAKEIPCSQGINERKCTGITKFGAINNNLGSCARLQKAYYLKSEHVFKH